MREEIGVLRSLRQVKIDLIHMIDESDQSDSCLSSALESLLMRVNGQIELIEEQSYIAFDELAETIQLLTAFIDIACRRSGALSYQFVAEVTLK